MYVNNNQWVLAENDGSYNSNYFVKSEGISIGIE